MRPKSFQRVRDLPLIGRAADWGMGPAAASKKTKKAGARISGLKATESICPYCAVGCGQVVYTRDGELVDIEGNPRSPSNQGTLCPKGSASRQLVMAPGRLTKVKYRRPVLHLGQATGLLHELTARRALGTERALVDGRTRVALDVDELAAARVDDLRAADGAVRADRLRGGEAGGARTRLPSVLRHGARTHAPVERSADDRELAQPFERLRPPH